MEGPVGEHRIRWIGEREAPGAVVLQAERKADDAEAKARSDHHDMPWAKRPDEAVVDETEPDVQRIGLLVVAERSRVLEDVLQRRRSEAHRRTASLVCR